MQTFNEAASAVGGGNLILTALFWAVVAFAVWIFWTNKWRLLLTATNPTAAALGLGKEAVGELIDLIRSNVKTDPIPVEPVANTKASATHEPTSVSAYINDAREILAGVPASLQLEILAKSPGREELYKAALEHFRGRAAVKEGQVANG